MKATKVTSMFFKKKKHKKQEELKEIIKLFSELNNRTSTVRRNKHNPSFKITKAFLTAIRLVIIFGPLFGWVEPALGNVLPDDFLEDFDFDGNEIGGIDEGILDSFTNILESLNDLDFDELYLNVEYIDVSDLTLDELQSARCNIELVLRNL
ncbi:hypothetical protein [Dapis sp. BLCC M172]|uniref:hypothetical protein n=1 Tax=Dapis sp. BLCC M172 TaxID=2975281 RepID=UPI003CF68734